MGDKKSEKNPITSQESQKAELVKDKTTIEKPVKITFRENRKFDLHIGRFMITFKGRETKKVPASWLKHEDFKNVSNYFNKEGA